MSQVLTFPPLLLGRSSTVLGVSHHAESRRIPLDSASKPDCNARYPPDEYPEVKRLRVEIFVCGSWEFKEVWIKEKRDFRSEIISKAVYGIKRRYVAVIKAHPLASVEARRSGGNACRMGDRGQRVVGGRRLCYT
ncbi:hypothetical protein K440DRAFT_428058 [Wilcoxina mikolae CBS 423.85]|nr:hypothetical protein K440DRAFT_428058 [Wilcoxina mikolae CBS 423.85]